MKVLTETMLFTQFIEQRCLGDVADPGIAQFQAAAAAAAKSGYFSKS